MSCPNKFNVSPGCDLMTYLSLRLSLLSIISAEKYSIVDGLVRLCSGYTVYLSNNNWNWLLSAQARKLRFKLAHSEAYKNATAIRVI